MTGKGYYLVKDKNTGIIKTIVTGKTVGWTDQIYQNDIEAEKQLLLHKADWLRYAQNLLDFLPIKKGRLLDVGCGAGWLVSKANSLGFEAMGIDPGRAFVNLGKKHLKANLKVVSLENFQTQEKFDVLVLNHVLEHISDLKSFLAKTRELLNTGGYLLVACPNINSLMFKIFKDRWYGLQPAQHIWQFTPESLSNIIQKNGFKVDKIKVNSLDYQLKGLKKVAFWLLTNFADFIGQGDQVYVLAKKI